MKAVLTFFATDEEAARVRAKIPKDTELFVPKSRPNLSRLECAMKDVGDQLAGADAVMGWVMPPGGFDRAKKLKALVWLHAGCDELDYRMLKERGIKVANIRGANAISVAEQAMALMLAVAKRIVVNHQSVQIAHWEPQDRLRPEHKGMMLEGKTLAIIGLGSIGAAVAKRARAFDMRVIGVRRHPEKGGEHVDAVHGFADLLKVLRQADFVLLATPITEETFGFIDEDAIRAMKPTAVLINVARGNLIQEMPLYEALKENRLAGFGTDVWWNYTNSLPPTYHYPIPSRTGIQRLPTVVGAGNRAGVAAEGTIGRVIDLGTESLAAFLRGQPMPRMIDLDLGY
ncbi:MAG: phosphoglycerate dehydrogenase [Rhodospirillales bacterium]|nr:phosphoglycerate dehydrogenase [Rhodospirillales bacterium]